MKSWLVPVISPVSVSKIKRYYKSMIQISSQFFLARSSMNHEARARAQQGACALFGWNRTVVTPEPQDWVLVLVGGMR